MGEAQIRRLYVAALSRRLARVALFRTGDSSFFAAFLGGTTVRPLQRRRQVQIFAVISIRKVPSLIEKV
jgi:hypothetical protein